MGSSKLIEYNIVYGKIVLYDYNRFSWVLYSISLKYLYQIWHIKRTFKTVCSRSKTMFFLIENSVEIEPCK